MTPILFYDTETSGLPQWSLPSEDPSQPHITQIAAELHDEDTGTTLAFMDLLIKPDGWTIPEELEALTGITNEKAERFGVSIERALALFIRMYVNGHGGLIRVVARSMGVARIVLPQVDEAIAASSALLADHSRDVTKLAAEQPTRRPGSIASEKTIDATNAALDAVGGWPAEGKVRHAIRLLLDELGAAVGEQPSEDKRDAGPYLTSGTLLATGEVTPDLFTRSQMAAHKRNADRYQWLRDRMRFSTAPGETPVMVLPEEIPAPQHDPHHDWMGERFDASVDRTIDAAMSASKEGA